MQSPKHQCIDTEYWIMFALGYNELTVDKVEWDDVYAENTCLISRAFYDAYVKLNIAKKVAVRDYYNKCSGPCNGFHSRKYIIKCAAHSAASKIIFRYNKYTKLLIEADFRNNLRIDFNNGMPVVWHTNWLSFRAPLETYDKLTAEVQNDSIVLVNKSFKMSARMSEYDAFDAMYTAGYRTIGFSGQFARNPNKTITCGDTQIIFAQYRAGREFTLDPGIKKMYVAENIYGQYFLRRCIDSFGQHLLIYNGMKRFMPRTCVCVVEYRLPEVCSMWDFSAPIPRNLLVENTHICSLCGMVEKN
jgi:hypothetical protein